MKQRTSHYIYLIIFLFSFKVFFAQEYTLNILSKNKFELFPIPLCSTLSLTQLQLGRNTINSLPDCIGQLKNLEHLDIWYNNIYALPPTISQLKKLKTLDFRGVNLSEKAQEQIQALLPSTKIEFDLGCDCAH